MSNSKMKVARCGLGGAVAGGLAGGLAGAGATAIGITTMTTTSAAALGAVAGAVVGGVVVGGIAVVWYYKDEIITFLQNLWEEIKTNKIFVRLQSLLRTFFDWVIQETLEAAERLRHILRIQKGSVEHVKLNAAVDRHKKRINESWAQLFQDAETITSREAADWLQSHTQEVRQLQQLQLNALTTTDEQLQHRNALTTTDEQLQHRNSLTMTDEQLQHNSLTMTDEQLQHRNSLTMTDEQLQHRNSLTMTDEQLP